MTVRRFFIRSVLCVLAWNVLGWLGNPTSAQAPSRPAAPPTTANAGLAGVGAQSEWEVATLGGGCFWCVEAVFENMEGVVNVISGYSGGHVPFPSYQQVSMKNTGHAEVCQVFYDPKKVSYLKVLEVFMKTHDPTTTNKQGPDYGPQYRSVIFAHSDDQKKTAEELIKKLDDEEAFRTKIVTKVEPFSAFYPAEEYHQDYYRKHPNESYCKTYVKPKITKFRKVIKELESREKK